MNGLSLRSRSVLSQHESESDCRGNLAEGVKCNRPMGAVGELCVALAHSWKPEHQFVILTAYLDESGTHDCPFSLMAGHIADARQWRNYEQQTRKLFRQHGVNKFHAVDIRRSKGCFKGWTVDEKVEFLDDYQDLINRNLELAFVSKIFDEDYVWFRSLYGSAPKSIIDSKYAILFRTAFFLVATHAPLAERWKGQHNPSLYMILEDGHPNGGDILRIYNEVMIRNPKERSVFKGIAFEPKEGNLPLAASDLLAYATYKDHSAGKNIGLLKRKSKAEASYKGNTFLKIISREELYALRRRSA